MLPTQASSSTARLTLVSNSQYRNQSPLVIKTLVFGPGFFYGIITDMTEQKYVYESPDGGHTVYRRKIGNTHTQRQLHSVSKERQSLHQSLQESKLWRDIKRQSESDPALKDMLEQIEIYSRMKYDATS
jgi:hypothetical protein